MLIIKKINYKIKHVFVIILIKLSLFLNLFKLTAFALRIMTIKINQECNSRYTVLCLGRSIFIDDINAMAIHGKGIRYIIIHRSYFREIFYYNTDKHEKEKLTEKNYHTHDYCREAKKRYYKYLKRLLPYMQKLLNFDAILTCNTGYIEQQEMVKICQDKKIPFIILHKEGLAAYGDSVLRLVSSKAFRFRGAKILFYNKNIEQAFRRLNIPGITEDKIQVVGVPRFDYFFIKKKQFFAKKQITFFSFYPYDSFLCLINNKEKLRLAKQKYYDFHRMIMEFALENPDINVIIKTKSAKQFIGYVENIYNNNFKQKINNLTITNTGKPLELIQGSIAVLGFNSTTLIEAVAADKTVICPDFRNFIKDKVWDFFADYPQLINYVETKVELRDYILNYHKYHNINLEVKNNFLKGFIFIPDGKASVRTEKEITKTINGK